MHSNADTTYVHGIFRDIYKTIHLATIIEINVTSSWLRVFTGSVAIWIVATCLWATVPSIT